MIDIEFQHMVLVVLLVLFYFLPADTLSKQSTQRDD